MRKVILASQSPRRRQLLQGILPTFFVMTDDAEEVIAPGIPPEQAVQELALQKASHVAARCSTDALVIGADTVVVLDNEILGKPENAKRAKEMLRKLSGRTHVVYTGIAVLDKRTGRIVQAVERTQVLFRTLAEEELDAYIATGEPMDKAGAYGIQEKGALFVEGIQGDFFNVVGLPLCKLGRILQEEFGMKLLLEACADN